MARLGIMGMTLADTIVVGQLAPDELPHQALALAPVAVLQVATVGLLQGVQVLAARSVGENNPKAAGVVLKRGLVIALVAGLLAAAALWIGGARIFTLLGIAPELAEPSARVMNVLAWSLPLHLVFTAAAFFMEAVKKPSAGTAILWLGNGANLGFDILLVPDFGAMGSAWATVATRGLLFVAIAIWIWRLRERRDFGVTRRNKLGPNYRALMTIGFAAAVSYAVEAGAFSGMTVIAGRIGGAEVAAYQILINVSSLVFMVAMGMSTATAVLVSEAFGAKSQRDVARAGWTGLGLNFVGSMLFAVGVVVFAHQIARGYTTDTALAALIAAHIWLCAIAFPPDGAQVVAANALRARGDNWFPTFSHIAAYLVVMPALGFWLAELEGMGVAGLLLAIFWASVLSGGVLVLRWAYVTWMSGRVATGHSGNSI